MYFFINLIYVSLFFNYEYFLNLDSFFVNYIIQILTFSVYKKITVIYILILGFIILVRVNFNKLVGKFADFYF